MKENITQGEWSLKTTNKLHLLKITDPEEGEESVTLWTAQLRALKDFLNSIEIPETE